MRKVRTLRHWKQRFQENAKFIWRRNVTWNGKDVQAGNPIPEDLANSRNKLRRFWEAKIIELAEFEAPDVTTGQKPVVAEPEPDTDEDAEEVEELPAHSIVGMKPEELVTKETDRKWHVSGADEVFKSKTLATTKAAELIAEAKAAEDAWLDGDNLEE